MKDMKWLYNMVITFFAAGCLTACSDYLEVDSNFKDRLTIEKVFTDKDYTDAWLSNTYSYLRGQNQDVGGKESVPTNFADDIYWADWNDAGNGKFTNGSYYSFFRNVEYNENWYQDSYKASYLGINKACVFLNNIHMNQQLTDEERADYAAQARFVRAYYYWLLLRKYGPIPLIPDEGEDYMQDYDGWARPRNTYDECVEYITSELVKAAQDLPLERGANNIARPTRGAALAARAKVLLYAASPLMNGNTGSKSGIEAKDVDSSNIIVREIVFTPGTQLKTMLNKMSISKYVPLDVVATSGSNSGSDLGNGENPGGNQGEAPDPAA